MKFEQLRYVLTIYQTGSISKAAKELFLSQPNISNSVKNLEAELGFQILERTANGILFTEKGLEMVYHARSILEEADRITGLSAREIGLDLRIVNPRYTPVEDAFMRLYKENERQERQRMLIRDANQSEAIELLSKKMIEAAFLVSSDIQAPIMQTELRRKKLRYEHLYTLPCNVNLSETHPLLEKDDFSLDDLKQYPFVQYNERVAGFSPYSRLSQLSFINLEKLIKADSRVMRSRFVSETLAYSVGVALPPKRLKELRWHCVPIEGLSLDFGYLVQSDFVMTPLFSRYLEFLEEEMAFMRESSLSFHPDY